jgi:hypothetical protein
VVSRRPVTPGLDFEDLIARVEAKDANALAPGAREEAARLDLHARPPEASPERSAMLDQFVHAARRDLERMAAAGPQGEGAPPEASLIAPVLDVTSSGRRWPVMASLAVAVAIVAVAATQLPGMLEAGSAAIPERSLAVDEAATGSEQLPARPARSDRPRFEAIPVVPVSPEKDPDPDSARDDARGTSNETSSTPVAPQLTPSAAPTPGARAAALDRLEREADRLWTAGDLDGAERSLRRIIARAGRRTRAELAYADLVTIAQQRSAASEADSLRREYLHRFPKGRFADDFAAQRCRTLGTDACWSGYRAAHPGGAHVTEAERALVSHSP